MKKLVILAFFLLLYQATNVYAQQFGGSLKSTTPRILNCNPQNLPTVVVEVLSPITGKRWMDRNLGASRKAISSNDESAYGDLYQWGRGRDGHQCRDSRTRTGSTSLNHPGHDRFIFETTPENDWRNPLNNSLGQVLTGINNPCPVGFRIPTRQEFEDEKIATGEAAFNSVLKLPYSGWRNPSGVVSDEALAEGVLERYGFAWTSTINGDEASAFAYYSPRAFIGPYDRARGYSVRCIKN